MYSRSVMPSANPKLSGTESSAMYPHKRHRLVVPPKSRNSQPTLRHSRPVPRMTVIPDNPFYSSNMNSNHYLTSQTMRFGTVDPPAKRRIVPGGRPHQYSRQKEVYPTAGSVLTTVDLTKHLRLLGKSPSAAGGNSDIWKGELRSLCGDSLHKQLVAIKVLRAVRIRNGDKSERLSLRVQREVAIWSRLQNSHVVPLIGYASDGDFPCMVSPWYEHGNVLDYIGQNPGIDKPHFIINVIDGLIYLHSHEPPIVHGDLKAANVLIDDDGVARISDFGLSTIIEDGQSGFTTSTAFQGSIRWMAPEIFFLPSRTEASDVYSLSLLILEIYSGGVIPFQHLNDIMFLMAICHYTPPDRSHYPDLDLQEQTWQVLEVAWDQDPERRPTAKKFKTLYVNALLSRRTVCTDHWQYCCGALPELDFVCQRAPLRRRRSLPSSLSLKLTT